MDAIQIVGLFFGLFLIYITYLYHKRKEFSQNELILWTGISFGIMTISMFPDIISPIVRSLNFARAFDLVVIIAIIFLIGLFFYQFAQTKRLEKKLEQVVRVTAIENSSKKKRKELV